MAVEPEPQKPIRLWGDEGAPRTIEPQTPAELAAQAADDLVGVLRAHFCHPSAVERGGSRMQIENLEDALIKFMGRVAHAAATADPENLSIVNYLRPYEGLRSYLIEQRYGSIDG